MTLAWQFKRVDPAEILLAEEALAELASVVAFVPAIWYAEVANGLLRGERQGMIPPAQTAFFLNDLSQANIEADTESPPSRQARVLALARTHGLTAYDATYLELALRLSLPLATLDDDLRNAAQGEGVPLLGK